MQKDIMNDYWRMPQSVESLVFMTHVIYALHSLALITGILSSATIIFSFIAGIPSLIAVILNYAKRPLVRGTWLESHFNWQIRTFWFTVLFVLIACILFITIIGIPAALLIWFFLTLWIIYRIAYGWFKLLSRLPVH